MAVSHVPESEDRDAGLRILLDRKRKGSLEHGGLERTQPSVRK